MNNLKINDKFENFIAKLPYNNNANEGGEVLIIHEIEGDLPTTSKTRTSGSSSLPGTNYYYLDKTLDEILNACENDIPIILRTKDIIVQPEGTIIEENIFIPIIMYGELDGEARMMISNQEYYINENNYLVRVSDVEH